MSKKRTIYRILIIISMFFAFLLGRYAFPNRSYENKVLGTSNIKTAGTDNFLRNECRDEEYLHIPSLDSRIRDYSHAIDLIKKECIWVLGTDFLDVTGDGVEEIIMNASGAGCGSCHARSIYIMDGITSDIVFKKSGNQLGFRVSTIPVNFGFQITEDLERYDEAYCCFSERLVHTYEYFPEYSTPVTVSADGFVQDSNGLFYKKDERSELKK